MRTLNKNTTELWLVNEIGIVDEIDENGFYTGDTSMSYSTPIGINLHLYPSNGDIVRQLFGTDDSFDMVSSSNSVVLTKKSLLFLNEPIDNFDITYDYSVSSIAKSKNTYSYGLKGRT